MDLDILEKGSVVLTNPIKRGETTIKEVAVLKPCVFMLKGISLIDLFQMQTDAVLTVLPKVTSPALTSAEAAKLDVADFTFLAGILVKKLSSSQM